MLSPARLGQSHEVNPGKARTAFEQDYDRIIFSHPFRKLQDKTQVHPLPEHDFVHTRLTHSLEVSSVGRSLGRKVGEVLLQRYPELAPDFSSSDLGAIVAAAALTHDIGNPPFGHAGESAISDFFSSNEYGQHFKSLVTDEEWIDLCRFEGNAQGFRLLNKNQFGLKLTVATLGAFTKYPCTAYFPTRNSKKRSQKKFGFFQSEKEAFDEVGNALNLLRSSEYSWCRHPLAFLVEAADDICYSIIDLEDGCSLGLITEADAQAMLIELITFSKSKLGKLTQLSTREERVGYLRALAIGDLTQQCAQLFLDHENEMLTGKFDTALADVCDSRNALKNIISISIERIYRSRQVVEIEASGHEILPGLMTEFTRAGQYLLEQGKGSRKYDNLCLLFPKNTINEIQEAKGNHYLMLRAVIDFISGLTDKHATTIFRKIKGLGSLR